MAAEQKPDEQEESDDLFSADEESIDLEELLSEDFGEDVEDVEDMEDGVAKDSGTGAAAKSTTKASNVKKEKHPKKKAAKTKKKPVKAARSTRTAAAPRPVRGRGSYAFVCSECYDEYLLPANYAAETVTCPECLHVGKRPDESFLRTVAMHKRGQRSATFAVAVCGIVLAALLLSLLYFNTIPGYDKLGTNNRDMVNYGLLGGSALVGLLFFWLAARYENNRWEVYF